MATPTRQMSRPQVRPMQPFRQSQALRPAVQQPMQQPMQRAQPMQQRAMQQPMQQQPMQQQQRSPMVQRPQASQPIPTRMQQPIRQPPPSQPIRSGPVVPPPMHPNEDRGRDYMDTRGGIPPAWLNGQQPGGNGLPGGLDPRAIAADPAGFAKWKQGAQAQEARMPGSTMLGQPGGAPVRQQPTQDISSNGIDSHEMGMPPGTYDGLGMPGRVIPGTNNNGTRYGSDGRGLNSDGTGEFQNPQPGGGIGMMTPNNPNDGMSLGSDWANPTPMPKPVMTEAPAQAAPSGLASFLQYQNSKPGGGGGQMSQPGGGPSGGYNAVPPAQRPPIQFGGVAGGIFESDGAGGVRSIEPSPYSRGGGGGSGGGGVGMSMPHNPNETGMTMGAFKRGGQVKAVKKYAKGGAVKSTPVKASSRGDGIAQRGKTKGKIY